MLFRSTVFISFGDTPRLHSKSKASGEMIVVRFADDSIYGFQHRSDAERFLSEVRERLNRFALELHPDKTRLIEFG